MPFVYANLAARSIGPETDSFRETLYSTCGEFGDDLLEDNPDLATCFEKLAIHLNEILHEIPHAEGTVLDLAFDAEILDFEENWTPIGHRQRLPFPEKLMPPGPSVSGPI